MLDAVPRPLRIGNGMAIEELAILRSETSVGLLLALGTLGVVLATGAEASAIVSCLIFIAGSAALSAWNWGLFSR